MAAPRDERGALAVALCSLVFVPRERPGAVGGALAPVLLVCVRNVRGAAADELRPVLHPLSEGRRIETMSTIDVDDAPIPYRLTAFGTMELHHARALDEWIEATRNGILSDGRPSLREAVDARARRVR